MMTNVSMNLNRLDNDKRLDEGVAALLTRLGPLEWLECLVGNAAFSSYSGLEFSMDSNVKMTMNTDVLTRQGRGSTLGTS